MALDENSLNDEIVDDNEVEKLMNELKIAEDMNLQDILGEGEQPSSEDSFDAMDAIPTEEFVDMDEIDAILSDVSEVHPERESISPEMLQERVDKYAENPEEAERLLNDDVEEAEESEVTTESGVPADDFLANLENVEEMLADVKKQAEEESEQAAAAVQPDADLDEINDLIQKSENNEAINDDLLNMIENLDNEQENDALDDINEEPQAEEADNKKDKKKKKKKDKKGKKDKGASDEAGEPSEKKQGLFAKILGFITEEDEENPEEEAAAKPDKKDKKSKKNKKDKSAKKGKDNADIEAELDAEDKKASKKKDKKEKKPKKEKKSKKVVDEGPQEKSNIKMGGIIFTALFCLTIVGLVFVLCIGGTRMIAKNEARLAYYRGDYETASNKLYGMKLSKSDELIFKKASLLYRFELINDKIEAYELMGDNRMLCDAMFELRKECEKVYVDAKLLNITDDVNVVRDDIDERIMKKYGISKEDIECIISVKPVYYTVAVDNLVAGKPYWDGSEKAFDKSVIITESGDTEILDDMLPEEAEIQ